MPNWSSSIFTSEKKDDMKFNIGYLKCPLEKVCKFRVPGTSTDPFGDMHRHFSAKEPHGEIGLLHCYACHRNFENKNVLSIHCQLGHEQMEIAQAKGAILVVKGKVIQGNKPAPHKKEHPIKPYVCFVCNHRDTHQSSITTHFLQLHRLGSFTCTVEDCAKKDLVFDNVYSAIVHYDTDHKPKKEKNGGVKRKC